MIHAARNQKLTGLYGITDGVTTDLNSFMGKVSAALAGGASIIQYRDKSNDPTRRKAEATALRRLCSDHNALFIINDDMELAAQVNADGVHLGQQDTTLSTARARLGNKAIIGISCYNQFKLAQQAAQQGADYIAFGRFFPSNTKPETALAKPSLLTQARQQLNIPICAIGGITQDNAAGLIQAGADMLAVIDYLFAAPDIRQAANSIHQLFSDPQHDLRT